MTHHDVALVRVVRLVDIAQRNSFEPMAATKIDLFFISKAYQG